MSLFGKWLGIDAEAHCKAGLTALDRRDFASAARAFESCLEASPRPKTARLVQFHLAECLTQLAVEEWAYGDVEASWSTIERALALTQPTAERHLIAAQIARKLDLRQDAAFHLDAALALAPDNGQARALRALAFYEDGRPDVAMAHAEAIPELDGRLLRFREAHDRGDREEAATHLHAVATGYPLSLL